MDPTSHLRTEITSQNLPCPSAALLASLTSTRAPPPALLATAKTRLLACDLTTSHLVDPSRLASLPAETLGAPEASLPHDTCVQVLDIENLSLSRWDQIQELEAVERGETTRGRHVIRLTDDGQPDARGDASSSAPPSRLAAPDRNATHRLVVQDRSGQRVYAVELTRMPGLGVATTSIGCKMVLRAGSVVARGTVLLTPETCLVLGGKVEPWHDAWVASRMARLREAAGAGAGGASSTSR
ncbi:hypothetical protein E4U42_006078 [Claviceps africana]|uniref:RecQ-mediated genome instability protein 1 n=1 Tax=Claviceps africana TaxID=83212 RepID=A0A8K0J4W5_9HYPO|nr:hypothetical protein E4U42_006078 [Claviceps africana]